MNNIDEILERLKGAQPEIDNPDEFTNLIMSALPEHDSAPKTPEKEPRIIKMVRIILSTAAVLLIGLFLYTNNLDTITPPQNKNYQITHFSYGDYLKNVYTNRQNKVIIKYVQFKKMNHENH